MPNALEKWFEFLKDRPIPTQAVVAVRIQKTLNHAFASHADFAHTLIFAPGLSIELFRNIRRLPEQPKVPIRSVEHAVAMLGLQPLQMTTLSMPSIDRMPAKAQPGLRLCYSRAIQASYFARHWAEMKRLHHPDEIALSALVDECGEMSLWANAPKQMLAINKLREEGATTDDAAIQILGVSINRISRKLAEYWHLPPLASESLSNNVFEPRALCVLLASNFARTTDISWINPKSALLLELIHEFLDISVDQVLAMIHRQAAEIARDAHFTGLPMAIHHLPLIPGNPAAKNTEKPAKPPERKPAAKEKMAELERAADIKLKKAAGLQIKASDPFKKGIDQLLNHLHRKVGLQRCMLAITGSDKSRLSAYQVVGFNIGSLNEFDLSTRGTLFSALLKKSACLWLNSGNRDKYRSLIPESADEWVQSDCFMMSLFCNEEAVGMIYADSNGKPLNQASYNSFKTVITKFAKALEKSKQCPPAPR